MAKKVLMIVAQEKFRDEELLKPKKILEEKGATVRVAAGAARPAQGMLGATVKPDLSIAEAKASDYDGVVVVGGMGSPEHLWKNEAVLKLLREASKGGKVVGAICLSGAVAAQAGILRGKRATVWPDPNAIEEVRKGGATYVREPVVTDGKIVTGDGPESAEAFGRALVGALGL